MAKGSWISMLFTVFLLLLCVAVAFIGYSMQASASRGVSEGTQGFVCGVKKSFLDMNKQMFAGIFFEGFTPEPLKFRDMFNPAEAVRKGSLVRAGRIYKRVKVEMEEAVEQSELTVDAVFQLQGCGRIVYAEGDADAVALKIANEVNRCLHLRPDDVGNSYCVYTMYITFPDGCEGTLDECMVNKHLLGLADWSPQDPTPIGNMLSPDSGDYGTCGTSNTALTAGDPGQNHLIWSVPRLIDCSAQKKANIYIEWSYASNPGAALPGAVIVNEA